MPRKSRKGSNPKYLIGVLPSYEATLMNQTESHVENPNGSQRTSSQVHVLDVLSSNKSGEIKNSQPSYGKRRIPGQISVIEELSRRNSGETQSNSNLRVPDQNNILIWEMPKVRSKFETFLEKFGIKKKLDDHPEVLGLFTILCIVAASLISTCIPQHDVIMHPEYWYEPLPIYVSNTIVPSAILTFLQFSLLLRKNDFLTWKTLLQLIGQFSFGFAFGFIAIYFFWVQYRGEIHPMPFTGVIAEFYFYLLVQLLAQWFLFPSEVRRRQPFRQQLLAYIQLVILRLPMSIGYGTIPTMPIVKQNNLQWTLGIFLAIVKKFNLWWNKKMTLKATGGDIEPSDIEAMISVGWIHSFSLSLILGASKISKTAVYIVIITDSFWNALSFKNIIRLHQQGTTEANEMRNRHLKYLALKEFLEILIPMVYCLSFTAAYLGPNAEILGNVKLQLWHFKKVPDLYEKLENVMFYTAIECLRGVSFGVVLWRFFKLNMFSAYGYVMRNYGWYILFYGICVVNGVSNHDFTH